MVNRTLRRKYNGNAGNTSSNDDGTGTGAGTVIEPVERIEIGEPDVDRTGANNVADVDGDSGIRVVEIDPADIGEYIAAGTGTDSGDKPRKRRGRKPGTGTRKTKAPDSIEPFLMMAHTWASVLLKVPEIAIDEQEAKTLSDAYVKFAQHHDIPALSEKRMSEINLISCVCMVYGPRFFAARGRMREEAKLKRAKNVTSINTAPVTPPFQSEVMN